MSLVLPSQGMSAGVWAVAPFVWSLFLSPSFYIQEDGAKSPALETSGFFFFLIHN